MTRHNAIPTELTYDERESLRNRPRELNVWLDDQALELVVARIKADAYNAGLAARGNNTTHETLRAVVVDILKRWHCNGCFEPDHPCGDPTCNYRRELLAALDAAPAPTDNQRDDGLDRVPCWRGECSRSCYYPDGCTQPLRAVVDGPTTPTHTPAASEGETNP